MEDLELLVRSDEFQIIKSLVDSLDPLLLTNGKVGAHLLAFRTGMRGLMEVDYAPAATPEVVPLLDEGD